LILVDSNILIDIVNDDPRWAPWSYQQIDEHRDTEGVAINQMIVAEGAPRFGSVDSFLTEIAPTGIVLSEFGIDAAFEAGMAFAAYRRNRREESPRHPLPDFFIGGLALADNMQILTRDPRFYRTYFPSVPLITPDRAEP
jgi:predicted nucleic acid-binding protein